VLHRLLIGGLRMAIIRSSLAICGCLLVLARIQWRSSFMAAIGGRAMIWPILGIAVLISHGAVLQPGMLNIGGLAMWVAVGLAPLWMLAMQSIPFAHWPCIIQLT
jgi:hypothetical protein